VSGNFALSSVNFVRSSKIFACYLFNNYICQRYFERIREFSGVPSAQLIQPIFKLAKLVKLLFTTLKPTIANRPDHKPIENFLFSQQKPGLFPAFLGSRGISGGKMDQEEFLGGGFI
jgi:hypothetical protein